jgi:hypothetical protein
MTIEKTLEILNGAWSILSLCLLVFLLVYFIGQWRAERLTWKNILALPLGMMVAVSLFVQNSGGFASRATVWWWRHFQGGQPLSSLNIYILTASAAVANIGALMVIRVFSRPRFGDGPWLFSLGLTLCYVGWALIHH